MKRENELELSQPNKLLEADGSLNPAAFTRPDERLAEMRKVFPAEKFNFVQLSGFTLSRIPPGVKLYPQLIEVSREDFWDSKNAPEVGLKPGHVMMSATFLEKVAQAAGVELRRTAREEISLGGVDYIRIEYVASMRLPNGTILEAAPAGKELPLRTKSGNIQAHIAESCDRKARRNAIKQILSVPTAIEEKLALRHWVVVKAIYDESQPEARAIAQEIRREADESRRLLYPAVKDAEVVPTDPTPPTGFAELREEMQKAATLDELNAIANGDMRHLSEIEHDSLRGLYARRARELREAGL